jgi:Subtilase family
MVEREDRGRFLSGLGRARIGARAFACAMGAAWVGWAGTAGADPTCVPVQRIGGDGDVFDTQLYSASTETSGTGTGLGVGVFNGAQGKSLIRFDLGFLEAQPNVDIVSATATFTVTPNFPVTSSTVVHARLVTSAWDERTASWSNAPSYGPVSDGAMRFNASTATVDLTAFVTGWVQGGVVNDGVVLEATSPTAVQFRSSEWATVAQRPSLTVCYTFGDAGSAGVCQASACNNGLLDPGEIGVDCGGPLCAPCSFTPSCAGSPDGTPCDDSDACTRGDQCMSGACQPGEDHVVCFDGEQDSCHGAGTCDPSTGVCNAILKPAGSACTDGNPYTDRDQCQSDGSCKGVITTIPAGGNDEHSGGGGGCSSRRWVGILPAAGACPPPPPSASWTVQKPFLSATCDLSPLLDLYCSYTWSGTVGPTYSDVLNLQAMWMGQFPNSALNGDCAEMAPTASAFDQETRLDRRQIFNDRAGALPSSAPAPLFPSLAPLVVVADTAPPSYGDQPCTAFPRLRSEHGPLMANVIRDLTCPGADHCGSCLGQVKTDLALAYYTNEDRDDVNGGNFGTAIDLGQSIVSSLCQAQASGSHLIINLSLGSLPGLQWSAAPGTLPLAGSAERGVFDTLRVASCDGAIVIAAAGNNPGAVPDQPTPPTLQPPHLDGPAYPAKWQDWPPVDPATCQQITGHAPVAASRPLVYAVSGLDDRDRPLMNSASGARPPLAALGLLATSGDPRSLPAPESGSSVAAAVTSAAAAAVWAYRPDLTADKVMQIVYDAGTLLDPSLGTPDFNYPTSFKSEQRRVSICEAVRRACDPAFSLMYGQPPSGCPMPTCAAQKPSSMSCSWQDAFDKQVPPEQPAILFTSLPDPALPAPQSPTEKYQSAKAAPWTQPSPPDSKCPTCGFVPKSGSIYMTIASSVSSQNVALPDAMVLLDVGGGQLQKYPLAPPQLPDGSQGRFVPGSTYVYQILGWTQELASKVRAASISFHVVNTTVPTVQRADSSSLEPMLLR